MQTSDFKEKWIEFKGQYGYLQRLDPHHPMDFFIGISRKGYEELVLITVIEPARLTSSSALEVEKGIRKDGRWATQICSVKRENLDIFARLCQDLVECSQNCKNEADGLSAVTGRYLAWQKMFVKFRQVLPASVLKGLIGEISLARLMIDQRYTKDDVILGWIGPDGADRDFVMQNGWYESKAISTGKSVVTISSLNQLETDRNGVLTIVNIDESASTDPNAFSVKAFIDDFRNYLSDAPAAASLFEQKLLSVGYIDKTEYESIYFVCGERAFYKVDKTFPRLVTENVPVEITGVRYDLSIAGIWPWKIGMDLLWS